MTVQFDVNGANLNQSGFFLPNGTPIRTRLKQVTYAPNSTNSGTFMVFDTLTTPVSATYARSGTTVTVTKTAHGLTTGTLVGIGYLSATGPVAATDGNYKITVVDANTFTITDPNSGTVASGTGCYYVVAYPNTDTRYQYPQQYLFALDTVSGQTSTQQITIPGDGVLINLGLYGVLSYIPFATVFYG